MIEADESDGTLVKYRPEIGLILNIDRDHKELDELMRIFGTFAGNCAKLAVNLDNASSASLSRNRRRHSRSVSNVTVPMWCIESRPYHIASGTYRRSAAFRAVIEAGSFVDINPVFRIRFGLIHGDVSFFEKLGVIILAAVVSGNSDADADLLFPIRQHNAF